MCTIQSLLYYEMCIIMMFMLYLKSSDYKCGSVKIVGYAMN